MKILYKLQYIALAFCLVQKALHPTIEADSFGAMNYAEAILGASRGPLSALSYYKNNKSKALQSLTDVVRIAHEACALVNHQSDRSYSMGIRGTWIAFDAIHFLNRLFFQNQDVLDDQIELPPKDEEIADRLAKYSQLFLLPATESIAALYQATNTEQTAQCSTNRRRAQALCSLARATSIFLNNRQSKAAIIVLIAAVNETMFAINETIQPPLTTSHENPTPQVQQIQDQPNPRTPDQVNTNPQDVLQEPVQETQNQEAFAFEEPLPINVEPEQPEEEQQLEEIRLHHAQAIAQLEEERRQLEQEQYAREEQLRQENEDLRRRNELITNQYQALEERQRAQEELNRQQEAQTRRDAAMRARAEQEARARIQTARMELRQAIEQSTQTLQEARIARELTDRTLEQERITGLLIDKDPDLQTINQFDALVNQNASLETLQEFVDSIAQK